MTNMLLNRKSVELLAPAGKWETLTAAIEAGADAVYLGGKAFNMRMFRDDFNFSNEDLIKAAQYVHEHGACLYITLNNLISDEELPRLEEYLRFLDDKVKPDALIVQDFSVLHLIHRLGLGLTVHSSIMMNTHSVQMIEKFKELGVTRVVASREMSLEQIRLLRAQTGIEIEYFVHGDMCIAEGGQCFHSGVVFGNSSNRGRCMKSCRWPYRFIEEDKARDEEELKKRPQAYKLALDDMCMYRHLPELIQSGVYSFKIEGRMRDAEFISCIVSTYRRAIDRYLADPSGYAIDESEWDKMQKNRVRDFSSCFAIKNPTYRDIGLSGEREPRFFSNAISEADLSDAKIEEVTNKGNVKSQLAVRCATLEQVEKACQNGADLIYAGGDIYLPQAPWSIEMFKKARSLTKEYGAKLFINTPRITRYRALGEMEQLFAALPQIGADGLLVQNIGLLRLAKKMTDLPLYAGYSFNLYNHEAAQLLKEQGISKVTASIEMPHHQVRQFIEQTELPVEIIVHGAVEAMICDFDYIEQELGKSQDDAPQDFMKHYALVDTAGGVHSIRRNQYGRNHILFAHDFCFMPFLKALSGAASLCIEAQDYTPSYAGEVVNAYRKAIDGKIDEEKALALLLKDAPRPLGCGAYRYKMTK